MSFQTRFTHHSSRACRGVQAVKIAILTLAAAFIALPAPAHPDLEEQIARMTADLGERPADAELLLKRADLYRRHAQYEEAARDIAAAAELRPGWSAVVLAGAKVSLDAGRTEEALDSAQRFLSVETNHFEGLIIRARACAGLNRPEDAIADFSEAITRAPAPGIDLFLERARAQAALSRLDDAVRGLDEGMVRVGELPAIQLPAIDYERRRKAFDAALGRVDKILARYPIKEPWLALRAEILEEAGRKPEARAAFQRVLEGINTYPPVRRALDLTQQLEARVRAGLARLELEPAAGSAVASQPFSPAKQ